MCLRIHTNKNVTRCLYWCSDILLHIRSSGSLGVGETDVTLLRDSEQGDSLFGVIGVGTLKRSGVGIGIRIKGNNEGVSSSCRFEL